MRLVGVLGWFVFCGVAWGDIKSDYLLGDQQDTLRVLQEDVRTDIETARLEKESRLVRWRELQQPYAKGAIPGATMLLLEMQMKLDALTEPGLGHRLAAVRAKLRSLERLAERDKLGFARGDRDTNLEQWRYFEKEREKAIVFLGYTEDQYARLNALHKDGVGPWARAHEAKLERDKAAAAVEGWQRKCREQERQYRAADAEVKTLEAASPPTP